MTKDEADFGHCYYCGKYEICFKGEIGHHVPPTCPKCLSEIFVMLARQEKNKIDGR